MNTPPNTRSPSSRSRSVKRIGQILVGCGVLALLLAGPLQPRLAAVRSAEGIYIPDARYQFAVEEASSRTKTLSHTFTLYNGRAQPLQVEAFADCGCTGLSWQSTTLPPLGRKTITAQMHNNQRSQNVGITFKFAEKSFIFTSLNTEPP